MLALLLNCLPSRQRDVAELENRLLKFGWHCRVKYMEKLTDLQDILESTIEMKENKIKEKFIMVFFFGYGYIDYRTSTRFLYMGSDEKNSVKHEVFYEKIDKLRQMWKNYKNTREIPIVIFTNCYWKWPTKRIFEYVELQKVVGNVCHLYVGQDLNKSSEDSSLLTRILLNEKFTENAIKVHDLSLELCRKVRDKDETCDFIQIHQGTTYDFFMPQFLSIKK